MAQRAKQVVWNQLLTPLRTEVLDELRWYFEQLGRTRHRHEATTSTSGSTRPARRSRPRFKALYQAWKQDGEPVLASAGSRAISDAVNAGAGRVETLELGHRYGHLAPLVAVA
jgi:hypothetical protein